MFFAKVGLYQPCGIFTTQHFILMGITFIAIIVALKYTVTKKNVQTIIKKCTIFVCICEIIIITLKIINDGISTINNYVPLYYCSLLIYAGLLSSLGKGKIKRVGDVFLVTGGMIGGLTFIIFPTKS